jgi:hypothetical protein
MRYTQDLAFCARRIGGLGVFVERLRLHPLSRRTQPRVVALDRAREKTSHKIASSARLRGTSFKSALPGRQIGSRTWRGAGRGVSDETKLELGSVDRRVAGFPWSD